MKAARMKDEVKTNSLSFILHPSAFILFFVALLAPACAPREQKPPARAADPTRELFERNCAICHGKEGEGRQVGTLTVPSLRAGRAVADPDDRLLTQIQNGGNGMPPFKWSLTDDQMQDLLRFVREDLQGRAKQ
jgi:mono/diheme cytochrome c family protein